MIDDAEQLCDVNDRLESQCGCTFFKRSIGWYFNYEQTYECTLLCIWLIKFQHKRGSNTFALLVYAAAIISVVSMTTCMCCWLDNNQ